MVVVGIIFRDIVSKCINVVQGLLFLPDFLLIHPFRLLILLCDVAVSDFSVVLILYFQFRYLYYGFCFVGLLFYLL